MPSTVTRSISVRSGGESVQLLGGNQKGVSMKTGGAGLMAQVDRVPFDVSSFDGRLISLTDHRPRGPLATVYLPVCSENQLLGSQ